MYYRLDIITQVRENKGNIYFQTRSQAMSSGIILPEVHDIDKGIGPNIRPEKTSYKANNITQSKRYIPSET